MVDKMKRKQLFPLILLSVVLLVVVGVNRNVYCQDNGYSLMVQQSPADGGSVSPETGIHRIGIDESVSLKATPSPGYRFVYWMGDVSSSSTSRTEVVINAPKIVVAVFERISNDQSVQVAGTGRKSSGGGGGGGESGHDVAVASSGESKDTYTPGVGSGGSLIPSSFELGGGGGFSGGGNAPRKARTVGYTGTGGSVLVGTGIGIGTGTVVVNKPIPEPATLALLGGGALMLLRRKR